MYWGIALPGLAMSKEELPSIDGLARLENAEVGDAPAFPADQDYTLEDLAERHLASILALPRDRSQPFHVVGISMGAMLAMILGTKFRAALPADTRFTLIATSPNLAANPAILDEHIALFLGSRRGDAASFEKNLGLLFSPTYRREAPAAVTAFFTYRAAGGNRQSGRAFFRQLEAIKRFAGDQYLPRLAPDATTVICGEEDLVFGAAHRADLLRLLPGALHVLVPGLGHMASHEKPHLFDRRKA